MDLSIYDLRRWRGSAPPVIHSLDRQIRLEAEAIPWRGLALTVNE